MMRSYPVLDPPTAFSRIPFKPHQLASRIAPLEGLFVLAYLGVPHVDANEMDGDNQRSRPSPLSVDVERAEAAAQAHGGGRACLRREPAGTGGAAAASRQCRLGRRRARRAAGRSSSRVTSDVRLVV